jgi:hypothetical protein
VKRRIAHFIDAAMNRYAPVVHGRTFQVFTTTDTVGADWLSEVEEHYDSLPPWQRHDTDRIPGVTYEPLPEHLRSFMSDDERDMADELWAAMRRHPVGKQQRPSLFVVPDQPAGAGDPAAVMAAPNPGAGGPLDQPVGAVAGVEAFPPGASTAASATGADGLPTEADLKVVVSRVLRDCGIEWPTTTTDMVVRELLLHFEFRHK